MVGTLPRLLPDPNVTVGVQETAFAHDVTGRFVCNSSSELQASIRNGGYPLDAVVIGAGMFGGYLAERLYQLGAGRALRILVLEAGALLFSEHIQNLPQRLGGPVGGPADPRRRRRHPK